MSTRFSDEQPVSIAFALLFGQYLIRLVHRSVVIAHRIRPCDTLGCVLHRLRRLRASRRSRTRARALTLEAEDPRARGDKQLPGRDMQLHGHVQLPDVVPDRVAY